MSYSGKAGKAATANRYPSLAEGVRSGTLSYGDCDAEVLYRAVEAVTDSGDAILFGRTSDGGALSVRVLSGGQTYAQYFPTVEALNDALRGVIADTKA